MGCSFGVEQILACLAFAINVIAAAAYFNMFQSNTEVHTGCKPGNHEKYCNASFYMAFSLFALGLVCLIFAIAEFGLMIKPDWFSFVDSLILRGVVYILSGIAVLGASGDLGIAAGALQMVIGVVLIIFFVIIKGKGGCKC